ncbi:MAG: hypothetical protein IKZ87_00825 [Actinomycetaceae bacterium]|nr:hypothetical protein [Actinomycetaceae bacterium]
MRLSGSCEKTRLTSSPASCFWRRALVSLCLYATIVLAAIYIAPEQVLAAQSGCDIECDSGNRIGHDCSKCGKHADNVSQIADNLSDVLDTSGHAIIIISIISGMIVVGVSLYSLYKSTKDERNKPTGAIIGLVAGGLMCGIPTLLWIISNTLLNP